MPVPPSTAETVAVALGFTVVVCTVKVTEVIPAGIVTVAGTVTADKLLVIVIAKPVAGAGDVIDTVPVDDLPPLTEFGDKVNDLSDGDSMVSKAVRLPSPILPVIVARQFATTGTVLIAKVAVVLPAGTITELGQIADDRLLDRFTTIPPTPAALVIVTVPVAETPPTTDVGLTATETKAGGVSSRFAD